MSRRLCRVCLATLVERRDGLLPSHCVALPDGTRGPKCRGSHTSPREAGYGTRHTVMT